MITSIDALARELAVALSTRSDTVYVPAEYPHAVRTIATSPRALVVLAVAILARYTRRLAGAWRLAYVISAVVALYLNVFVLIAQLFLKVPALKQIAPTQSEPPFLVAQLAVMAFFIVFAIAAAIKFRNEPVRAA